MISVKETPKGVVLDISSYNPTIRARIFGLPDGRRLWVSRRLASRFRPASGDWHAPFSGLTSLTPAEELREEAESLLREGAAEERVRVLRRGGVTR